MITVLLIEDEQPIRDMMRFALSRDGINMLEAADSVAAFKILDSCLPDVILLDWMLPEVSGIKILKQIRKRIDLARVPVIMLTARADEEDKVAGLEAGADDYVTKPFSPRELIARVRATVRRSQGSDEKGLIKLGKLVIDIEAHRVKCSRQELQLGPVEYRLLLFMASHRGRVYSRSALLNNVWTGQMDVEERTVDVYIRRLRKLLEPFSCDYMLKTVRGTGYRFDS